MQDPHVQNWLAAYLYRAEPWEPFLQEAVQPFVRQILSEGLADGYFFIRYWEQGPHVRLRFHGNPQILAEKVRPRLEAHFSAYFDKQPSHRDLSMWPKERHSELLPNDHVHFTPYEPEYDRYGGKAGIVIAERHFQASSEATFAALDEVAGWTYERALGLAIQMHLGFAHAMEMKPIELLAFFRRIAYMWMGRAYYLSPDAPQEDHARLIAETQDAFATAWESQKEGLVEFCGTLWQGLREAMDFDQAWFKTWQMALAETHMDLHQTAAEIDFPNLRMPIPDGLHEDRVRYWPILESYIHMTNNRLGILNRDEAFLGFLIDQSMQTLLGEEKP